MRIGFDSKRLYCNFTGLGNYSRTLVKNLYELHSKEAYHLYTPKVNRTPETTFFCDNTHFQTIVAKTFFKSYWRSFSIVNQLKKDNIELYHGLSNEIPLTLKETTIKSIVTIHDLIFKMLPHTYPLIDRNIYDLKFRMSCLNSDRIIAISHNTKNDIVKFYGVNSDKIEVIYQCCNPIFYENTRNTERDNILEMHNIPNEYILYVGSLEKRKNLSGLIEAYQYLKPELRIPIVVVGECKDKGYKKELYHLVRSNRLENKVLYITNLKDNYRLKSIYQKAMALVYPSFYEGFGLPIVEALLSKTPVITSNISALPEAGGPKSFYINPKDAEEIADAITQVLSKTELRRTMIENGYEYAIQTFAPAQVTNQVLNCYERTLCSKK